jgi:hypothetical protein
LWLFFLIWLWISQAPQPKTKSQAPEGQLTRIPRRNFLHKIGQLSSLAAFPLTRASDGAPPLPWTATEWSNSAFRLSLSPPESPKQTRLLHVPTGLLLADAAYSYSPGLPKFREPSTSRAPDGSSLISLQGILPGDLEILHEFRVPTEAPWIEEQITLANRGSSPLDLQFARCGFVLPLPLPANSPIEDPWSRFKLTAIPFRREPNGSRGQYADFSLPQILTEQCSSELWTAETSVTPAYAAEGWAWTDGTHGFLLTKYSQQGMEWSLLDRVLLDDGHSGLRWGGCGIYRGDPEHGAWLLPGESHRFGVTRLTAYAGGVVEGFYAFRQEMEERGHGCPKEFNPPVHWNELYDNKLWWLPDDGQDDPEMRKKFYTLADMKQEAAKAKSIGCEALYMDPGWDNSFASKLWDEPRLGLYKSFVEMLHQEHGLKSSLHTPLSGWCDPTSYPAEMYRLDRFGQRLTWNRANGFDSSPLCGASRQYVDETARRLLALARDGCSFFMFDGTRYHAECWDPHHGHRVPARREEHVQATYRLARAVHAQFPQLLIEMHDAVMGGDVCRAAPIYYGHGHAPEGEDFPQALGFDSVWAFELMWRPMEDLLSGRAIALYYYNLAYNIPLYIHVDLRTDNQNALVFWWNASTCRHFGIGGTHANPAVRNAHQDAMATYIRLAPCFKAGRFYGMDELTHLHVHPTKPAAVMNCFNLENHAVEREVEFIPQKFALDPKLSYQIKGVPSRKTANGHTLLLTLPPQSHKLAEIEPSASSPSI